jgi:hypothetical protein
MAAMVRCGPVRIGIERCRTAVVVRGGRGGWKVRYGAAAQAWIGCLRSGPAALVWVGRVVRSVKVWPCWTGGTGLHWLGMVRCGAAELVWRDTSRTVRYG